MTRDVDIVVLLASDSAEPMLEILRASEVCFPESDARQAGECGGTAIEIAAVNDLDRDYMQRWAPELGVETDLADLFNG